MFRKIFDRINPMVVLPVCGVIYGLIRGANAYVDSVKSGPEMTTPQIAGYMLGAVFVWGLAGLAVAWALAWFENREIRKQAGKTGAEHQG